MTDVVLVPDEVLTHLDGWIALAVSPPTTVLSSMVPMNHVAFAAEPYFVVNGHPVADEPTGTFAAPEIGVGTFGAQDTRPNPWDTVITESAPAQGRWLPLVDSYADGLRWRPFSGSPSLVLDASSVPPVLNPSYTYNRGGDIMAAMSMSAGQSLYLDGAPWASNQITVLMVVVLHAPENGLYGVLGTGSRGGLDSADTPFVELLYTTSGELQMHTGGMRSSWTTHTGVARAGQPVIVGFSLNVSTSELVMVCLDKTFQAEVLRIDPGHPMDARLWIGNASTRDFAWASMDILEIDYWSDPMSHHDLDAAIAELDQVYGVIGS